MKPLATLLAGLLLAGAAIAGDVYVTRDAKGNLIYTDTPQSLPAQKLAIQGQGADPATATKKTVDSRNQVAQAAQDTAEDRAKRCTDARQQYQMLMTSWEVYTLSPDGKQNFLTSEQIDQARANAKQVMDQFCTDQ